MFVKHTRRQGKRHNINSIIDGKAARHSGMPSSKCIYIMIRLYTL